MTEGKWGRRRERQTNKYQMLNKINEIYQMMVHYLFLVPQTK